MNDLDKLIQDLGLKDDDYLFITPQKRSEWGFSASPQPTVAIYVGQYLDPTRVAVVEPPPVPPPSINKAETVEMIVNTPRSYLTIRPSKGASGDPVGTLADQSIVTILKDNDLIWGTIATGVNTGKFISKIYLLPKP